MGSHRELQAPLCDPTPPENPNYHFKWCSATAGPLARFNSSLDYLQKLVKWAQSLCAHFKSEMRLQPTTEVNFLLTDIRIPELASGSYLIEFPYCTNES